MTETERKPAWLQIAAAVMVGEQIALFSRPPIGAPSIVVLAVTVLLAWLLLRGSRVVWVFAVFTALAQIAAPFTMGQPIWLAATAATLLACLLAPPSRRFVWAEGRRPREQTATPVQGSPRGKLRDMFYGGLARVTSGTASLERAAREWFAKKPSGKLIATLVICVVVLIPVVGALYRFHHGAASGNLAVDVLWHVVWLGYTLVRLALLAVLVMAAYHYVAKRRQGLAS